ncbi:MAG: hypothetical protein JXA21_24510 [Anaerolineae bacterium]|nr:hypothetical protein [Anaerolineae bacterium]
MQIFSQIVRLITQPPGDLVYFLVTLFALQQVFFANLTTRKAQTRTPLARRWLWTASAMVLGRLILMIVALLGSNGLLSPSEVLPPLERWLALMTVLLGLWTALFEKTPARWQTLVLLVLLVSSLILYVYDMSIWLPQAARNVSYNATFLAFIWDIACLALILVGFVLALVWRPREWEWLVATLLFWGWGHAAQLLWPDAQVHFAGWQRLLSLVVFPMLSILAHKQVFSIPLRLPPGILLQDSDALLTMIGDVESGRELETALILASSRVARLLNAEICAVALTVENNDAFMRVVAVHPPNAAQLEAPELEWGAYATLYEACTTRTPGIAQPPSEYPWLDGLYRRLGFSQFGPLVALPLYYEKQNLGLLLLGNPDSGRSWSRPALEGQKLVAGLLSVAITRARSQGKDRPLREQLRSQDAGVAPVPAQGEVAHLQQRIAALMQDIESRDQEILLLTKEIKEQSENKVSQSELAVWQNEVREMSHDRDMLAQDRNRLAEQLSEARELLEEQTAALERVEVQLQQTQSDLEAAQKSLETPSAQATGGLIVVDKSGQIILADPLARRMLHLPQGEVIGIPIDGAYPDPKWAKAIDELLSTTLNARRRAQLTLTEFDHTIDAELVTLSDRDGIPDGLVITLRTPESAVEQQESIVSMAHEFRTPMTAIAGYTDLLMGEQAGILNEMQLQFLERVKANVEQLGHLLNDLISIASPDSRPIELSPQLVNLIEIVEEAIMGLAARFRDRRLAVQLDLPPELALVRADHDSLYQIMLRLLSNAALCSKEGSEVAVRALPYTDDKAQQAYIQIMVVDTGGGIDPDDYTRVFRRLYRANQPLIQGMGETGIGMAVSKTLVEANGGRIWVESQPNIGSTFSFILPTDKKPKK